MLDKNIFNEVPQVVHNAVLSALDSIEVGSGEEKQMILSPAKEEKRKQHAIWRLPKIAIACLVCFLISGITVSAMHAINLYKQRMEAMNEQLLEEYYAIAMNGEITEHSRALSEEEQARYETLEKEYENNGVFPEKQITYLQDDDVYGGKGIALDGKNRTLFLPEELLSDEELLEIIDFNHKIAYSVQEQADKLFNGEEWKSRLSDMSAEEVDEIYLIMYNGNSEVSGVYSRMFTEDEQSRYGKLNRAYEKEGLDAASGPAVIQTPEEYNGEGIAVCVEDCSFYFPERELTDEELMQLVVFEHKALYCLDRIAEDIELGLREGYPRLDK